VCSQILAIHQRNRHTFDFVPDLTHFGLLPGVLEHVIFYFKVLNIMYDCIPSYAEIAVTSRSPGGLVGRESYK
jgi:hypothetical protein